MIRSIVSLCGLFLILSNAWAANTDVSVSASTDRACRPVYFSALSALDKVLQLDEFRIHYTLRGTHALKTIADADSNGTPDMVDDLALQLTTARSLYGNVFGLRHPLEQLRYVEAKHINVYVLAMKSGNGMAFDEVVSERIRQKNMECGLRIFVDHHVQASRNLTPAHELFHLYQYAYSMFKSPWYLEGMARWTESFFRERKPTVKRPDQASIIACEDVYGKTYAASTYWQQRAGTSGTGLRTIPVALRAHRYSDGRAVIDVEQFQGGDFLLHVLQALESASVAVAKAKDLPSYRWPESLQKSKQFDDLICSTIKSVVVD